MVDVVYSIIHGNVGMEVLYKFNTFSFSFSFLKKKKKKRKIHLIDDSSEENAHDKAPSLPHKWSKRSTT
jgi:hypothetical protein